MRANAAVFEKLFTPLSVTEVEIDEPGPGEALVRVVAAGVCHTDALARDGDMPFPAPGVLGHEGAGVVAAVGDGVTSVSARDKVVIGWPWCGSCRNCLEGQPRYCLQLGPLVIAGGRADGSTSLRRLDGSPLHSHFFGQSSFASYSICAASALVKVPGRGRRVPARPARLRDLDRGGGGAERAAASCRLVGRRLRRRARSGCRRSWRPG